MSYGIQVAQLAGIPKSVVATAKRKLIALENNQNSIHINQAELFAGVVEPEINFMHPALLELDNINPNDLTPIQALNQLYALKKLMV